MHGGPDTSAEPFKMPSQTTLGPICLRVTDLEAELKFYEEDLGFRAIESENQIGLSSGTQSHEPTLILKHYPEAKRTPRNSAGLYHFALLLPDRSSLALAYLRLDNSGVVFDGYADHLVSEALYLTDPERNGIEIYADKPRNQWPRDEDGDPHMGTNPLDIDSLLKELSGSSQSQDTMPDGTRIGHVHLKVTELKRSIEFYCETLGFDVMSNLGSAAFLSAGGYHHHIGLNTWESYMGESRVKESAGLEYFTISLPSSEFLQQLISKLGKGSPREQTSNQFSITDPDGIGIIVRAPG